MFGQGSPAGGFRLTKKGTVCGRIERVGSLRMPAVSFVRITCLLMAGVFLFFGGKVRLFAQENAASVPIRINISWTSDSPRFWDGEIALSNGFFWNSVPLGSDPAASVLFNYQEENTGHLPFSTLVPAAFCGIQTTVVAPADDPIHLELRTKTGERVDRTFRLRDIISAPIQIPMDAGGNGVFIERAAGDTIPLSVSRLGGEQFEQPDQMTPSMVFDTGETLIIGLFAKYLPITAQPCRLRLALTALDGTEPSEPLWTTSYDMTAALIAEHPRLDISVPLTDIDGAFEVVIELVAAGEKGRFPILSQKDSVQVLARRTIQGVALPRYGKSTPKSAADDPAGWRGRLLETVDPTNPSWWQIFSRLPEPKKLFKKQDKNEKSGNIEPAEEPGNAVSLRGQTAEDSIDRKVEPLPAAGERGNTVEFLKKWRLGELRTRIPSLYSDISWGQWDSFWQHPLGSGHLAPMADDTGRYRSFVQLNNSSNPLLPSWEAYVLPVKEPGKPHLLEIDYPADFPMAFGVSIIEPSVTGGVFPRTLDGGVSVFPNPLSDRTEGRTGHYQVLFWPKTETPTILITAPDPKRPAIYGRIRLFRAKDDFAPEVNPVSDGRSFTAVMTRPFLCDQFQAERKPSPVGVVGAEDWKTFDSAVRRMADYLSASGYDSLLMSAAADGSALYPSAVLRPNPKYDGGLFLGDGPDPVRKDVPEFIFRLFDRRGLTFMPMIDFNAPLPMLEEGPAAESASIHWIGPDGQPYRQTRADGSEVMPYNLLDPAVQNALLQAVNEVAARYAHHHSFGGVGLELSAESAAVLPQDPYLGLDDATFGRFASDMLTAGTIPEEWKKSIQQETSASDPDRFRRRAMLIRDGLGSYWLAWRADTVKNFCSKAAALLTARSAKAKLHLVWTAPLANRTMTGLLASDSDRSAMRTYTLLQAGYDPKRLALDRAVVFYRPGQLNPEGGSFGRWSDQDGETPEFITSFESDGAAEGAFFYHRTTPRNLPTFDAASPFRPTVTDLETILLPSDDENRRRFAHQAAVCDTLRMADGGRMIPAGAEESLYEWMSVWRRLPNLPFQTTAVEENPKNDSPIENKPNTVSTQPVVFRTLRTDNAFWAYLVNDAPYHCGVNLSVRYDPAAQVEVYVGGRTAAKPETMGGNFRWDLSLRPYDLVALKITDPKAEPVSLQISRPEEICAAGGKLQQQLENAADRIFIAASGLSVPIENPGFNLTDWGQNPAGDASDAKNRSLLGLDISKVNLLKKQSQEPSSAAGPGGRGIQMLGWRKLGPDAGAAGPDSVRRLEGNASIRLINSGNGAGIEGKTFDLPASGRLFICAGFGLPENCPDLPLQVTLTGECNGKPWERTLVVGPSLLRRAMDTLHAGSAEWTDGVFWVRDVILFDDLPTESLSHAVLRFDLYDRGTVWLDEVTLYSTAFLEREKTVQAEAIRQAVTAYREGRFADAAAFLDYGAVPLLTEAIPDQSPLWQSCPVRPEYARFGEEDIPQNREEPPVETAVRTEESSDKTEKKNFFQKIIPW